LYDLNKFKVAEHSIESGHRIKFHETIVLAKTLGYMDQPVKEATEIKLHLDNINRKEVFGLGKAWNPSTCLFRHSNKQTSQNPQEVREEHNKKKTKQLTTETPG
jgi:hypothetical protein